VALQAYFEPNGLKIVRNGYRDCNTKGRCGLNQSLKTILIVTYLYGVRDEI